MPGATQSTTDRTRTIMPHVVGCAGVSDYPCEGVPTNIRCSAPVEIADELARASTVEVGVDACYGRACLCEPSHKAGYVPGRN